jgi:dienelactone hydrolase
MTRVGAGVCLVWVLTAVISAQMPDGGLPRRPSLGVALGPHERGALVTAIVPGSAAEAEGITTGDVISAVDGAAVRLPADVIAAVAHHAAGDSIRLEIIRAEKPKSHVVRLASYPRETMPGITFEYGAVTLPDGSRLRTIVSVPSGNPSPRPAVMLLPGGGCGSIDTPMTPDVAQPGLMRALAVRGYVTLRVEKSGVGDSRGPACDAIGYIQELDGYRAALSALKQHPSVDLDRVFLLGISLGGVFAPTLANESAVRGIVVYGTLAAPPSPYPGRSDRFFRELAPVDAAGAWSSVSARVLVLHGEFDESTAAADHERIAASVNSRHPARATHVELPGLDHCWTRHESMEESRGRCGRGRPDTTLSDTVIRFVQSVAGDP